jgi:hypothetical protein
LSVERVAHCALHARQQVRRDRFGARRAALQHCANAHGDLARGHMRRNAVRARQRLGDQFQHAQHDVGNLTGGTLQKGDECNIGVVTGLNDAFDNVTRFRWCSSLVFFVPVVVGLLLHCVAKS